MELERLSDFTAKVDAIEVTNERSTINASAEMESYGRVRFSLTLESGRSLGRDVSWLRAWGDG